MGSPEYCETNSNMTLDYTNRILMEEDIDDKISINKGQDALQTTEKHFYDILGKAYPSSSKEIAISGDTQADYFNDGNRNYHEQACSGSFVGARDAHSIATDWSSEFDRLALQFNRALPSEVAHLRGMKTKEESDDPKKVQSKRYSQEQTETRGAERIERSENYKSGK
ncbi:hypothetical protein ABZP36_031152 [Zizania latifolia]